MISVLVLLCRCVRFLSEHGCTPLSRDSQGWQPIHWAAASGHASCVRTLLDNGAKRDCITNVRFTDYICDLACSRILKNGSLKPNLKLSINFDIQHQFDI